MADNIKEQFLAIFNKAEITKSLINETVSKINKSGEYKATANKDSFDISIGDNAVRNHYDPSTISFYDLKAAFSRSSKRKQKKNGGWYLIVPIGIKSKMLRKLDWSTYKDISHDDFGDTEDFGKKNDFQSTIQRENQSGVISDYRYQWKSANVTRVPSGKGNRAGYMSFRTVSDTSDPMAWLVPYHKRDTSNPNPPVKHFEQLSLFLDSAIDDMTI